MDPRHAHQMRREQTDETERAANKGCRACRSRDEEKEAQPRGLHIDAEGMDAR